MDKKELDNKISQAAMAIMSYCTARTSNRYDAEDLAQEIVLQLYISAPNIKNDKAFYGFMWSVAGNVYKRWCRKRANKKDCELEENIIFEEDNTDTSDIALLRRELSILNEKYRKAVVLYYVENKSCLEISDILRVSESTVKYLLFKSRQILKEGMMMERNYGQQSYAPKELSLLFWGEEVNNEYYHLCDSKISQNILFACYNDKLTAEQISLEIGVALPYMEDTLKELFDYDLLKKEGNKYYTNIVIFTDELSKEVFAKTSVLRKKVAQLLIDTIKEKEEDIRFIDFKGADMGKNSFYWQAVCIILRSAIVEKLQNRIKITYPKDKLGTECFILGVEESEKNTWKSQFSFGISNASNKDGDLIQFMDFETNGNMVHKYFYGKQSLINIFLDIAKGDVDFGENDKSIAAELVKQGYVLSEENGLVVNVPIFTRGQYSHAKELLEDVCEKIADSAEELLAEVAKVLRNHIPAHLKKSAKDLAYLRLLEDTVSATVEELFERKELFAYSGEYILPTTYIILA